MIKIKLNDGKTLSLPEEWGELNEKQTVLAFRLFSLVLAGEMTPFEFQVQMLFAITGYKPNGLRLWHRLRLWWLRLTNAGKYAVAVSDDEFHAEMVQYNLIHLAEMLCFAFEVKDGVITPNYYFSENPFADTLPNAPKFTRRYTIETNMTARQFADGVDLMAGLDKSSDLDFRHHILRRLAATLCKLDYEDTMSIPAEILFGLSMWFTGVVKYFQEHPVYKILFASGKSDDSADDILSLGMNEVILSLQKNGYANASDMNLIDFMDAQIKGIKDNISKALAEGAKPEELARKTHLPYNIIMSLV